MKLRDIQFGPILGASGVQGFFGEGYWFHPFLRRFGLDFSGMTLVAKTTTLHTRKGNAKLKETYKLAEWFPRCIKVRFLRGAMLNSVGLSGPGLGPLLETMRWQTHPRPFFLSFMSLADSREKRMKEVREMVETLQYWKHRFQSPFGLQINLSCPNTGHDPAVLIQEASETLDIAARLDVPLMPKFSIASAPIEAVLELEDHPHCDAICVSNTIPFGWEGINNWKRAWGSKKSPLAHIGGGGLSGKTLLPLVCTWIKRLRHEGFTKPINGGGGILSPEDVTSYHEAQVDSVFLGSAATLRFWRVSQIIKKAHELF